MVASILQQQNWIAPKRLYVPQSLKYLLSENTCQAQEPSQLRQRRPSNNHRCLSVGCCSYCQNAFSSVPVSWQCQQEIESPRQTYVIGGVQVTHPRISCKGSGKPDHQIGSSTTHSRQGPNPERGFWQQTAKHTGGNWLCVMWTKPSTTTQLGSFYFLWFNPNTGFSANLTNKRC